MRSSPGRPHASTPFNDVSAFAGTFADDASEAGVLVNAVAGLFANGGGRCCALDAGGGSGPPSRSDLTPLGAFEDISSSPRRADEDVAQGCAAVHTPRATVRDAISGGEAPRQPPSGDLAGLHARTDAMRVAHKAPANGGLAGVRVWGVRTLADRASEFRHAPVRRLMGRIALSLARGARRVVLEPDELKLWTSLRRDISAVLHRLWRDGAQAGAAPEQAFFVKCDAETSTQAGVDAVIGVAPVRPAAFVVLILGRHWQGEGEAA